MEQIERIGYMEEILEEAVQTVERLEAALERYRALIPRMNELEAYYTSRQWMKDYEDDEEGRLPQDLKRGVLSEDAIYDLLSRKKALEQLLETACREKTRYTQMM